MASQSPIGLRIALVLGSTAVALALGWGYLKLRGEADLLITIDNSDEVLALLDERSRDGAPLEAIEGLRREPIDAATAAKFFPALRTPGYLFDPQAYYMREGNQHSEHRESDEHPDGWIFRTNAQGLREDEDVLPNKPDVRILVTGDSHTGGVVPNHLSFTNLLEAALAKGRPGEVVEALNTGLGGYSFYNYLGILEKFDDLDSDVFIVACYGGNDFSGMLPLYRYFNREHGPNVDGTWREEFEKRFGKAGQILSQELTQAVILDGGPEQVETAITSVLQATAEIARHCRERGMGFVCTYIPPPLRGQPERYADQAKAYVEVMGVRPGALEHSDRVADAWLAFLQEQSIPAVDMRPIFADCPEELYWPSNSHINRLGNELVAEALLPLVTPLLKPAGS